MGWMVREKWTNTRYTIESTMRHGSAMPCIHGLLRSCYYALIYVDLLYPHKISSTILKQTNHRYYEFRSTLSGWYKRGKDALWLLLAKFVQKSLNYVSMPSSQEELAQYTASSFLIEMWIMLIQHAPPPPLTHHRFDRKGLSCTLVVATTRKNTIEWFNRLADAATHQPFCSSTSFSDH